MNQLLNPDGTPVVPEFASREISYPVQTADLASIGQEIAVIDWSDVAQYAKGAQILARLREMRLTVEKRRKELKQDALDWGKRVDGEAKTIAAAIESLEKPAQEAKRKADQAIEDARKSREEQERLARDKAEQERLAREQAALAAREADLKAREAELAERSARLAREDAERAQRAEAERQALLALTSAPVQVASPEPPAAPSVDPTSFRVSGGGQTTHEASDWGGKWNEWMNKSPVSPAAGGPPRDPVIPVVASAPIGSPSYGWGKSLQPVTMEILDESLPASAVLGIDPAVPGGGRTVYLAAPRSTAAWDKLSVNPEPGIRVGDPAARDRVLTARESVERFLTAIEQLPVPPLAQETFSLAGEIAGHLSSACRAARLWLDQDKQLLGDH